jgi:MFS family permease
VLLFLPQFMQKILGWNPLQAGAGLLPLMAVFAASSFAAGPLYERLGAKTVVTAGAACLAGGTFLISLIGPDSGWGELVPGMVVTGLGVGLFYSSITTAAVTALDPSRSSLAGGIVYMFQVAGGSVGLGLTTTVFTTASEDRLQSATSDLSDSEIQAVQGALAGTESAAEVLGRHAAGAADRLVELVREAFMAGLTWSFRLVALLALGGLVVSVLFVGGPLGRSRHRAPAR